MCQMAVTRQRRTRARSGARPLVQARAVARARIDVREDNNVAAFSVLPAPHNHLRPRPDSAVRKAPERRTTRRHWLPGIARGIIARPIAVIGRSAAKKAARIAVSPAPDDHF